MLLDTHVAIWLTSQPSLVPEGVKASVANAYNEIFVSSVSILEIAIKHRTVRSDGPGFGAWEAISIFETSGYQFLDVTPRHSAAVETLVLHHKDPFDHLIVAQAISESMYIVSNDSKIALYDCPRLPWE